MKSLPANDLSPQLRPIPQPAPWPFLGNITDLDPQDRIASIVKLMGVYGDIVKVNLLGKDIIFVGSQEIVHDVCDQERFEKMINPGVGQLRKAGGDGLFTAYPHEENWGIAHRILIPAFGPISIRGMFDGMSDIVSQLVTKWHRFGDATIDVASDFTKLTLDTIALCTFSSRFNSFYSDHPPPFVLAMYRGLQAAQDRSRRIPGTAWLYRAESVRYEEDIRYMHDFADRLTQERIDNGEDVDDLLGKMLKGKDPNTGKGLSPENIRYQIVTFLVAGHETTSGMLSFLFHYLLKSPRAVQAIRDEVDRVCGSHSIRFEDLHKFKYIDAAMKETLRLWPTAPAFTLHAKNESEIIAGQYEVKSDQLVIVIPKYLHRDPLVWGQDAEEFRPERMLDGGFEKLPPDSWKPFGNGVRACIGRPFVWQEGLLAVATIFQHFDIRPHDADYELQVKESLTLKPKNLYMHVSDRKDRKAPQVNGHINGHNGSGQPTGSTHLPNGIKTTEDRKHSGPPFAVYYGSNAGTCKALASKMADSAIRRGLSVKSGRLNELVRKLPKDVPLAIITASYEGQPTDDAAMFYQWLKDAPSDAAARIKFAVFSCGHPDWQSTYHAVPTFIDERLAECGGKRIVPRGKGDASAAELFETFDEWETDFLDTISKVDEKEAQKSSLTVEVDTDARKKLLQGEDMQSSVVISNNIITKGGTGIKRHVVLELPEGMSYRTGDYLSLLPTSPLPTVRRALGRFGLSAEDLLTLRGPTSSFPLPIGVAINAQDLVTHFVELAQPVTSKQILSLLQYTSDEGHREVLQSYASPEVYAEEITAKRISLLDILEELPSVRIPLEDFLMALPPMRMRQNSISSSPLETPNRASLTVAILEAPHLSGKGTVYHGTATHYLSHLEPGSRIRAGIRPSSTGFHPPSDPSTPIIMAAAGSGIAPFRAFVQERALQKAAGRTVGPAMIFYGCHSRDSDALYDEEMSSWAAQGVVTIRHAFSRVPNEAEGCKYVQDRIFMDRYEVMKLFEQGARIYICGSVRLAKECEEIWVRIYCDHMGKNEDEGREWLGSIQSDRFATDVFA